MNLNGWILSVFLLLVACGSPEERVNSYLERAEAQMEAGEYELAMVDARSALQIQPKNPRGRLLMAKMILEDKKYRSAIDQLMIAVEADPDYLEPHVLLGEIFYMAKDTESIEEHVKEAVRIDPDDPRVLLLESRLASLAGDLDLAREKVNASLDLDPFLSPAIVFKASLLARGGDEEEAINYIESQFDTVDLADAENIRRFHMVLLQNAGRLDDVDAALRELAEIYPENDEYTKQLANRYIRSGRVNEAEQVLRDIANRDADNDRRRLDLIEFLAGQRSLEAAEQALGEFIEASPDSIELRLAYGSLQEASGNIEKALENYKAIVDLGPTSDAAYQARNRIVSILLREGDEDQARSMINGILEDQPDNVDALIGRAVFSFSEERYDDVIVDARVASRKNPESLSALLLKARAHARMGQQQSAQDAYQSMLVLDRSNPVATAELAALFRADGNYDSAETLLRDRIATASSDFAARAELVQTLAESGNFVEAKREARTLAGLENAGTAGQLTLARILQSDGDHKEAIAIYREIVAASPPTPEPGGEQSVTEQDIAVALRGLTQSYIRSRQPGEAAEFLQGYLATNPKNAEAKLLLARSKAAQGKTEEALKLFEELIEGDTLGVAPYIGLARLYPVKSKERIDALERGVNAVPDSSQMQLLLAEHYRQSGAIDKAINVYEAAVQKESFASDIMLTNNFASLLLDYRNDPESLAKALKISQQFETSRIPALLDTLGWAYYRNNNYPAAVQNLEKAVSLNGKDPTIRYHLGLAYLASGNKLQGKKELERITSDPNAEFPELAQAKDKLATLSASDDG